MPVSPLAIPRRVGDKTVGRAAARTWSLTERRADWLLAHQDTPPALRAPGLTPCRAERLAGACNPVRAATVSFNRQGARHGCAFSRFGRFRRNAGRSLGSELQ